MENVGIISNNCCSALLQETLKALQVQNPLQCSSADDINFVVSVCKLIIVDDEFASFSLLSNIIKNSCTIFLMHYPTLSMPEVISLNKLANEANVSVYLFDEVACQSANVEHYYTKGKSTLIDCRIELQKGVDAELQLLRLLSLLVMIDPVELRHIGLMVVPPSVINIRYLLRSGSVLRILMNKASLPTDKSSITIYRPGSERHDLQIAYNSNTLSQALQSFLGEQRSTLPNLGQYERALKLLYQSKLKRHYVQFFSN